METPIERIRQKVNVIQCPPNSSNDISNTIEDIFNLYTDETIVPVICEDMYEYKNPHTGETQTLQSYIVEKVIDSYPNKKISLTEDELQDIIDGGYYGLSLLEEKIGSEIYSDIFRSVVKNTQIREGIGIKKEVADFLNTCDFPLIITTNCFAILEKSLGGDYNSAWYSYCTDKTKVNVQNVQNLKKNNTNLLVGKTIYHLFGQAQAGRPYWGHNEMEILELLKNLVSQDYAPTNLTSRIGEKRLLILGNNTPEWLFRFIISPIQQKNREVKSGYYFENQHKIIDKRLELCLHDFKFDTERQMIDILNGVSNIIQDIKNPQNKPVHNKEYDFFISHSSKDIDLAKKIKRLLENKGLKVWIDTEKWLDGNFWDPIIDGIKNSAFFLPLVTESFMNRTCNGVTWKEALKEMNVDYLPIDAECAAKLMEYEGDEKINGLMVELLLADSWREDQKLNVYSIPVILKGAEYINEIISVTRISNFGCNSRRLPKGLFHSMNTYIFDNDVEDGLNWEDQKFNYDNYKSEKRKTDGNK